MALQHVIRTGLLRAIPSSLQPQARAIRNRLVRALQPPEPAHEYRVGTNVVVCDSSNFDVTYGRHIFIDDDTVVSVRVRIVTHDGSSQGAIGATFVAPVHIGKRCFIGADSMILPGVTVGDDSVVAAGAVVTEDVQPDTVVAGVPARPICSASELHAKRRALWREMDVVFHEGHHGTGLPSATHGALIELAERDGGYFVTWSESLATMARAKRGSAEIARDRG